jgi:hypothetical protein
MIIERKKLMYMYVPWNLIQASVVTNRQLTMLAMSQLCITRMWLGYFIMFYHLLNLCTVYVFAVW